MAPPPRNSKSDIEYFSEAEMDRCNLENFKDELPLHLKEIFESIWQEGSNYFAINVLQGYETSCEFGVKSVTFKYGASNLMNILPIIGTIIWGIHLGLQDTNWHTLFFDQLTGDILDEDLAIQTKEINHDALIHNQEGKKLYAEHRYEKAINEFDLAYVNCDNNYIEKPMFLYNKTKANGKWAAVLHEEGVRLFEKFRFEEAAERFEKALHLTDDTDEKNKLMDAQAMAVEKIGNDLEENGFHDAALQKYHEAKHLAKEDLTINSIGNSVGKFLAKQAQDYFRKRKYALALIKYEEARNNTASKKNEYLQWCKKIEKIIQEQETSEEGYLPSYEDLDLPSRDVKVVPETSTQTNQLIDLEFEDIQSRANFEYEKGEYVKARDLYQRAFNLTKGSSTKEILQDYIRMCENEIIVCRMKEEANKYLSKNQFEKAKNIYKDASVLTKVPEVSSYLTALVEAVEYEEIAQLIKANADEVKKGGDLNAALSLYKEAYMTSKMSSKQQVYLELIKETEKQAIELQQMTSDDSIVILDTEEEAGFSLLEQDSLR